MNDPSAAPPHADVRRWPADPAWFVDTTRCPACFTELRSTVCSYCGLDVAVPASAELLERGREVHDGEESRQEVITRMRREQAVRERAATTTDVPVAPVAVAVAPAVPVAAAPVVPAPVAPAPTIAASPIPTAAAPVPASPVAAASAGSRRSGVQVALLTIGVVLVSVAAIVFLFVAYLIASLEVRSVIIGVGSALVLVVAALLRARRLPGTAEGVAAVAVVLILLDVWIIRANELFGSASMSGAAYTGVALAVVAVVLGGVRLLTGIRTLGFVAAVLAPVSALVLGIAVDPWGATGWWLGGLLAAAVGSWGARRGHSPEEVVLRSAGFGGLGIAVFAAFGALGDVVAGELWAFLAVAAVSAVTWVITSTDSLRGWSVAAAVFAGTSVAAAPVVAVAADVDADVSLWLAPALGGVVAAIAAWFLRNAAGRRDVLAAFIAAGALAGLAAVPGLALAVGWIGQRSFTAIDGMRGADASPLLAPAPDVSPWVAAVAALVVAAGSLVVLALLRGLPRFAAVPAAALGLAALAGASAASPTWVAVLLLVTLGAAALAAAATRFGRSFPGSRVLLAATGIPAAAVAIAAAASSNAIWPWAATAVVLTAVAGRVLASRTLGDRLRVPIGSLHLVAAAVLASLIAATAPAWLDSAGVRLVEQWTNGWLWVGVFAAVAATAVLLVRALADLDRVSAALPVLAIGTVSAVWCATVIGGAFGWLPAALLAVGAIAALRGVRPRFLGVVLATIGPVVLTVALHAGAIALELDAPTVAQAGAVLLAAGLGLLVVPRTSAGARIAWISSTTALLVLVAVISIVAPDWYWLVLLVLAPAPILLAAEAGDPIGGTSPLRHLSWLTLPLVVGAVWAWLAEASVDQVEPYTLPLAVVLAAAAALIAWRRPPEASVAVGRTTLLAAAAAVAVLPSAAAAGESELRTLIVVAAGAVVAIAAAFVPVTTAGVPARLLTVLTAWTAMTVAAVVRGATVALGEPAVLPVEFWPAIALVGGLGLAIVWTHGGGAPRALGSWLLAGSLVLASVPTMIAIASGDAVGWRGTALVALMAAVHVWAVADSRRAFAGPAVAWTALALSVVSAVVALGAGIDPFDLVTVPIAAGLLAAGAVRMRRDAALRSWPAIGIGLAVLLVPAFFADWFDAELWRLVALGVLALATLLIGVFLRLQAPFVLGGAVLVAHGIVQLWPWISWLYEAVWWWLWLGIAGALLITLAATYERQLRLARRTVHSIGELR